VNILQDQTWRAFLINVVLVIMIGVYCFKAVRCLPRSFRLGYLISLVGVTLNWLVISVNGGQMPVVGYRWQIPGGVAWRGAQVGDRLLWLADRFPYHNSVFSVGDVIIFLGFFTFLGAWAQFRYQALCLRKSES